MLAINDVPDYQQGDVPPAASSAVIEDRVRALYRQYLNRDPTDEELRHSTGLINSGQSLDQYLQQSAQYGGGNTGGNGGGAGTPTPTSMDPAYDPGYTQPYTTAVPTPQIDAARVRAAYANGAPDITAATASGMPGIGGYTSAPIYTPLTAADLLNEPGYQFRLGQGEQALQQSAAAKGLLNTGGTLKDVLQYGQNFASNEWGNANARKLAEYQTTQYAPWLAWNQGNLQANQFNANLGQQNNQFNAGQLQQTNQFNANLGQQNNQYNAGLQQQANITNANLGQQANQFNANMKMESWVNDYNKWRNWLNDSWSRQSSAAGA